MKRFNKNDPQGVMIVTRMVCTIMGSVGVAILVFALVGGIRGGVCAAASATVWNAFWLGVWSRGLGYDTPYGIKHEK